MQVRGRIFGQIFAGVEGESEEGGKDEGEEKE